MKSFARSQGPIHLGMDVSKDTISVGVLEPRADVPVMTRISSDSDAVRKLVGKFRDRASLRVCYEAGPTGFTLARTLAGLGVSCDVVAPSRLPRESANRIKTDHRDAASLACLHRAGLLTPVHVPAPTEEAVRDLCRARQDLYDDLKRVRRRLLAFLLRRGIVYRAGSTWTRDHHRFLSTLELDEPADRETFSRYLSVVRVREAELAAAEREVLVWLDRPPFAEPAHRLAAYRGVGYIAGMTLASEVGEWTRFRRPTGFMSFIGLVPSEYSSGGRRRQGGITKAGNTVVRTQLVESAWLYRYQPYLGRDLRERQTHVGPETVARSWKTQQRLCARYRRLSARQLDPRIVVTALARELAGFLWAEMNA